MGTSMTTTAQNPIVAEIEIVQEKIATQHFVIKSSNDDLSVGAAAARLRELHEQLTALQAYLTQAPPLSAARL